MISDELFDKILHLEKQSGSLIEEAKKTAQQIHQDALSQLANLKDEAEKEILAAAGKYRKELECEEQELKLKYHKLFEDISKKVFVQRDQHLSEFVEEFKNEMMNR